MRRFWERVQQRFEAPDDPLPSCADVAIALGYGLAPNGKSPSPQSAVNAAKAVDLFLEGRARSVLFVGGGTRGGQRPKRRPWRVVSPARCHDPTFCWRRRAGALWA